jgi:hypothetical protein
MGIPTSYTGMLLLCRGLFVDRSLTDALLVLDTHILQSISAVTCSNFILWGHSVAHYFGDPLITDDMCTTYFYVP